MKQFLKTIALSLTAFISTVFMLPAQNAPAWKLDKSHTSVTFSINHFFSKVTGRFTSFDGSFSFSPTNLEGSKAEFSIDVKTVYTEDEKRDKHLQSPDFFDSKAYPKMTFSSTRFEKKSETDYVVHGKITIRNTTRDIAIPFKVTGEMDHPMMKGTHILGLLATCKINRTDFGVGTGSWAATAIVGDEVTIEIPMELIRK